MTEQEPSVRMALSQIGNAMAHASRLDGEHDSALEKFEYHAAEAIHQLRLWAEANGIEVLEAMQT